MSTRGGAHTTPVRVRLRRVSLYRCAVSRVAVCLTVLLTACGASGDTKEPVALPPGMRTILPPTNADLSPPAVPFDKATPRLVARAVHAYPHDAFAYTQGLMFDGSRLIESTGLVAKSDVREVRLETGAVVRHTALPASEFGEGIAMVGDRIYQVTWQHGRGYIYNAKSLALIGSMQYDGEGWGLTTDGAQLYLSDGTSSIRVIAPDSFRVVRRIDVTEAGTAVPMLNELEWVRGELWANIYKTDLIARIDPTTGHVTGWIDVSALLTAEERTVVGARGGVANGIAWDSTRKTVALTGKYWPRLFEIALPAR